MARELAVRADFRGFDEELIELTESLADASLRVIDVHKLHSETMAGKYREVGMDDAIEKIIDQTTQT